MTWGCQGGRGERAQDWITHAELVCKSITVHDDVAGDQPLLEKTVVQPCLKMGGGQGVAPGNGQEI